MRAILLESEVESKAEVDPNLVAMLISKERERAFRYVLDSRSFADQAFELAIRADEKAQVRRHSIDARNFIEWADTALSAAVEAEQHAAVARHWYLVAAESIGGERLAEAIQRIVDAYQAVVKCLSKAKDANMYA